MLNLRHLAVAGAVIATAAASPALAANGGFDVYNGNAAVSAQRVWATLSGDAAAPWTPSTLERPVTAYSTSNFTVSQGPSRFLDVKVQFSDGDVQTFAKVNVCRFDRVLAT